MAADIVAPKTWAFRIGDRVLKVRGSRWEGAVVGYYSTEQTPEGYCVESCCHSGSVQIYPVSALALQAAVQHLDDHLTALRHVRTALGELPNEG